MRSPFIQRIAKSRRFICFRLATQGYLWSLWMVVWLILKCDVVTTVATWVTWSTRRIYFENSCAQLWIFDLLRRHPAVSTSRRQVIHGTTKAMWICLYFFRSNGLSKYALWLGPFMPQLLMYFELMPTSNAPWLRWHFLLFFDFAGFAFGAKSDELLGG